MRVLFASAELSPLVRVGGLAEASAGLTRALRAHDVDVDVVIPDYGGVVLAGEQSFALDVPDWVGGASVRRGNADGFGAVTLIDVPQIARPHPYLDPATGEGWADNDARFFRFSAAIAALVEREHPDLLHCNDWHTGAVLGLLAVRPPTVLTIHTLGYQGVTAPHWRAVLTNDADAFEWYGGTNPLAGAIHLADLVVAVSPTYAREIVTPQSGMSLHELLLARGDRLVGIRNGIDTATWNPANDPNLSASYDARDMSGKQSCRVTLASLAGWRPDSDTIIGMVTRLTGQKGVDLALSVAPLLDTIPARLLILGAGERAIADAARAHADARPDRVAFREGYDDRFGHVVFGGADLFLMPSRFEPCGLAQMQAMAYGTIPVVTDVGGLHDTVIDDDRQRRAGTGFVSRTVDPAGVVDAVHRAVRAQRQPARRRAIQRRGMQSDWSWDQPSRDHLAHYESLLAARA
ncbi:MAG TPA: glycogen/starch synthase [Acidimicrobiales bacterium]|jgi:starch synthase|nr:glycogen/starch synthase [Acidimicrobiales bacterium]